MSQPLEVSDPAEGSVDWKGAREFVAGKPVDGAEAGEGEAQPTVKEFKYRGKAVKVDADTYSLLEDLRRETRGTNGRLGSENAQLRERLARLEGAIAAGQGQQAREEAIRLPDPMLATRDIAAYQAQMEAYHAAKREQLKQELEEKYLGHVREVKERVDANRAEEAWVNSFYATYDHLDHPDIKPVVMQAYIEHAKEIDALKETDLEAASERLADLADARLVRLRNAGKSVDTTPTNRKPPRFESSAGAAPRAKADETPREFSAASWVARQRLKMSGQEPKKR